MRILLTESEPTVADGAARTLSDAGHDVLRCTPPGGPAFPCTGLSHDDCPLDAGAEVAVAVRGERRSSDPSPREMGVSCALRHRLPVVVAGGDPQAFQPWAARYVADRQGPRLLAAVEDAGSGASPAHAAVAAAEVERRCGVVGVHAEAVREGDRLAVRVVAPTEVDAKARETLGVQVAGALRRFDRHVGIIDVGVEAAPR